jgi:ferredoxin
MVRISVNTGTCVGAAQCVLNAPDVFDQGEDGFVEVIVERPEGELANAAREASHLCPSRSITIHED